MPSMTSFPVYTAFVFLLTTVIFGYDPLIKVTQCSPDKIVLTLSGAIDGGIIYIKGHGAACQQETTNETTEYEFTFDACGVNAYNLFHLIVQKNPFYQTGEDLQMPIWCIYEMTISVNNEMDVLESDDTSAGINKTVRPSASMFLFKDGQNVAGSDVMLGESLTMTIQLPNEYIEDFDIRAKYCTANSIKLIENFCAVDSELFPTFQHPVQGALTASFSAFRTTDYNGGAVSMVFSCTLHLCNGLCIADLCSDGQSAYGRKKRSTADEDDVAFDDVSVGAMMRIAADDGPGIKPPDSNDELCLSTILIIVVVAIVSIIITFSVGTTITLLMRNPTLDKDLILDVLRTRTTKDESHSNIQLDSCERQNIFTLCSDIDNIQKQRNKII